MKQFLLLSLISFCCLSQAFSQKVIELKAVPAPADIVWKKAEAQKFLPDFNLEMVHNVSKPTLTAFLPDPAVANGTALVIAPGGGFHFLSINNEGNDVAKWCTKNGIAAFVLRYRLVPTGENPMAEFGQKVQQDQEKMDREMAPVIALANADGLAAIEYVRNHAAEYGVKPDRIGIMGFSAGGTVAAAAAFHHSEASRPDFSAPIYPALHVVDTSELPENPMPLFIAVTSDDVFGFQTQCTALYDQWNQAKQPIELHIYNNGGHGFGMRKQNLPSDRWIDAFSAWLDSFGFLKP